MNDNSQNSDKNQIVDDKQKMLASDQNSSPINQSPELANQPEPNAHEQISDSVSQPILEVEEVSPEITNPQDEGITNLPLTESEMTPMFVENKNKIFFIVGGLAIFLMIFFFISRFFLGKSKVAKPIKLVYWGLWEEKEVFEPLIKIYQQKNPQVIIDYQKMDPQEYKDRLLTRGPKGIGPDIFRFHNTWLPEIKDIISPLPKQVMTSEEFEKTFYPVHQKDLKVGNYYYGLPLMVDGLVLIYNEDLLKQVGITSVPSDWEQIIEAVGKLTVKDSSGMIITAGIALGTANNIEHFSEILGLMFLQNGVSFNNLDQPEAAGALETYRKFAEPPNNFWSELMPNSIVAFAQGKVAMIIAPSWWVNNIKLINPDINVKMASVPNIPGAKPVSLANYWVEGVSRYSKNQLEAWRFLRFLVDKENLTKLYQLEKQTRVIGEPYSRVDLASLLIQDPYAGAVIKQAKYFVSLPLVSRTYDNGLNDEIVTYIENAINSTAQGVSYNQAVEELKKGVDQVLEKYKI